MNANIFCMINEISFIILSLSFDHIFAFLLELLLFYYKLLKESSLIYIIPQI